MQISELTLINVRTFSRLVFPFKKGFNLIVGENGAGKSTILRAIQNLLAANRGESIPDPLADQDITFKKTQLIVEGKCQEGKRVLQLSPYVKDRRKRGGIMKNRIYGENFVFGPEQKFGSAVSDRWPIVLLYGPIESTSGYLTNAPRTPAARFLEMKRLQDENWLFSKLKTAEFGYVGLEYSAVRKMLGEFIDGFSDFNWKFEFEYCTANVSEGKNIHEPDDSHIRRIISTAVTRFLRSSPESLHLVQSRMAVISSDGTITASSGKAGQIPPFWELIKRYFDKEITYRFGEETIGTFGKKIANIKAVIRLSPRIRIIRGGDELTLEQMSHGEQRLFSLMVDITRQLSLHQRKEKNIREVEAVVLIDEIDIHLHPKWQRMIVPSLEKLFPSCQFIATTHSPQIVAAVEPEQVLLLTEKGVVQPDRTLGMDSNWILRHLMDTDERPAKVAKALKDVEALISKGEYPKARKMIAAQRKHWPDIPDWAVLETRIIRLKNFTK